MTAVARAIAAAARAHQRVGGVEVRYVRPVPGQASLEVTLRAVPGQTTYETLDAAGTTIIAAQSRDYLIVAADLVLDGEPTQPARGDRIIETEEDGDHTYELLELPSSNCWRWSDEQHVRYRVHTKQIT